MKLFPSSAFCSVFKGQVSSLLGSAAMIKSLASSPLIWDTALKPPAIVNVQNATWKRVRITDKFSGKGNSWPAPEDAVVTTLDSTGTTVYYKMAPFPDNDSWVMKTSDCKGMVILTDSNGNPMEVFEAWWPVLDGDEWTAAQLSSFNPLLGDGQHKYNYPTASGSGTAYTSFAVGYDEALSGIAHALGFNVTAAVNFAGWQPPANHLEGGTGVIPHGCRLRLKSSVDTSKYSPVAKNILAALKTYGAFAIDRSLRNMEFCAYDDSRWLNTYNGKTVADELQGITSDSFEVVSSGPIYNYQIVPPPKS